MRRTRKTRSGSRSAIWTKAQGLFLLRHTLGTPWTDLQAHGMGMQRMEAYLIAFRQGFNGCLDPMPRPPRIRMQENQFPRLGWRFRSRGGGGRHGVMQSRTRIQLARFYLLIGQPEKALD
jgi:hypothetical protein